MLRRHRIICNVLSPLVLQLNTPLLTMIPPFITPSPEVFRNFALWSNRSIQISGNGVLCALAAFLALLLTHKHSQVQFSPRPGLQGTEPDKQSHRDRTEINICQITLLTSTKVILKTAVQNWVCWKEIILQKWSHKCQKQSKREHFVCDKDVLSGGLILIWIPKKSAVSSLALKQEVELWSSSPRLV